MKKHIVLNAGLILILGIALVSCGNPAKDALSDEGFVNLYNGENFDGWYLKIRNGDDELAKKVFCIAEDGVLHVYRDLPDSSELNTGVNDTHGMIWTDKSYSKYIFRFEYKWGTKILNNFSSYQYDAGCYYHVFDDNIWPKGIEYQVRYNHLEDQNHTGDFWAASADIQWYAGDDGTFLLPSDGGKPQPIKSGEHLCKTGVPFNALNGEWNKCEIIVMGDAYSIQKLNGEIVNMATDLSVGEGIIGLQSETAELFYRNIMIKEFDEEIPMEVFLK